MHGKGRPSAEQDWPVWACLQSAGDAPSVLMTEPLRCVGGRRYSAPVLDGLDDVGWAERSHAYGSAADIPVLLRQAASDGDAAREAISALYGTLFHQGTVYPATAAAVPFLAELAQWGPSCRSEFCWMLGMMADPHHADGSAFDAVRAAVAAHAGVFTALLADADAQMRAAAAYAVAQCAAPVAPLWDRWEAEEEPCVRASLVLALGLRDPAGSARPLADAVMQAPPAVRAAAALVLARNRIAWPDGAVAVVVSAIDAGAGVEYAWCHHYEWTDELLVVADDRLAAALLAQMLAAAPAKTRRAGVRGMTVRGQARRSAPALLLPMVRPLLDDPDQGVRDEAVGALRRSGAVSGQFSDELSGIAARYPQTAGQVAITPELKAVETLMLLGDPRWLDPVCAAVADGHDVKSLRLLHQGMHWSPRMLGAVRRRLAELSKLGCPHPAIPLLATVLGQWGSQAVAAVPELLAVLPYAGETVARALVRIGHRAPVTVPYLRALAVQTGDLEAAMGVWRLTGDPQPLVGSLHVLLRHGRSWLLPAAHTVTEVGNGLLPLVPAAQRLLTGTAAETYPQREVQVLAARVVSAATGDPALAVPTVRAVLAAQGTSASRAADLVADLAATHPAAVVSLTPVLGGLLDDQWSKVAAARALWRLGTPPAELVAPLTTAITAHYGGRGAVALLVDMHAVEAIAVLEQLAERDERIVISGLDDDLVWQDEKLREQLRAGVAALRAA